MKVSFTLCTKNGGERLRTCLAHIEAMDADPEMELFLVDNGSDDGVSYPLLQEFAANSRFDARVRQTMTPGNSAGRNIALAEATGDVHIFIDDDCYADPQLVREWQRIFAARPGLGFAAGMVKRYDHRYSGLGCVETPHERPLAAGKFVPRGFIQGSNMAFRRQCLIDAGDFDERLGAGTPYAGEEWDLCLRASRAGWAGGYFPEPKVAHDHRRAYSVSRERLLYYDLGGGVVYAKNTLTRSWIQTLRGFGRDMVKLLCSDRERFFTLMRGYSTYLLTLRHN